MKTIATFTKPEEAHLLRMRLEDVGIEAFVQDENVIQMDLLYSNALGGVRVQVADGDYEAGKEFLSMDHGQNGAADALRCPNCDSTSIEQERFSRRIAYLSLLIIGIPLLFLRRRLRCSACLHTWKP